MATAHHTTKRASIGAWLRFGVALVVTAAVTAVVPLLLVVASRVGLGSNSPLPGIGTWDQIRSWATTERSSTEIARVALRVLIALCWLLWAALVGSLLSSLFATRPRLGRIRLPRLTIFDGFGTWLVAGLTALSSLTPNIAHAQPGAAIPRLPVAAAVATPAPSAALHVARLVNEVASPTTRPGWETVQAAESIEMFAARTLGDPGRWPDVFDLNRDRPMNDGTTFTEPWNLTAGWELELPTTTAPAAQPDPVPVTVEAAAAAGRYRAAEDITVAAGDNLWDLAAARLRSVGLPDDDATVARLVNDTVATNPAITDPNLIHPGQHLTMPAVGTPPADTTTTTGVGADGPAAEAAERTHAIRDGDTLWDITRTTYGYVTVPLVDAVATHNDIVEPNNIPIGTIIRLPALDILTGATATPPPPPTAVPLPPPGGPTTDIPPPVSSPPATPLDTAPPPSSAPPLPSSTTVPPTTTAPTRTTEATSTTAPTPAASTPDVPADRPVTGRSGTVTGSRTVRLPWTITGVSVALATGVVELWRRRRRTRWAAGGSPWQIGAASEPTPELESLATHADLPTVEWVAAALTNLAAHADRIVTAVDYDPTRITVHWDRPDHSPTAPWTTSDGRSWDLAWPARLAPPADSPAVGYHGLVTVGEHDGRQHLINLAAFGAIAVDGPGTEAFVGALVLELGCSEILADAIVHLHAGIGLSNGEQLDRIHTEPAEPDDIDTEPAAVHVSVVESDDPVLDDLLADTGSRRVVIILGTPDRPVGAELFVAADGTVTRHPDLTLHGVAAPGALICTDDDDDAAVDVDDLEEDGSNVVVLDRSIRDSMKTPRVVLRLFSSLLPNLEPAQPGIDARAMTIIAALDHLGAGAPPQQLAEVLGVQLKTIQNKLAVLREQRLVYTDSNVWTLDGDVCSDAEWIRDLADAARDTTSRDHAARALNEIWELLNRVTGPAYAAGGASTMWAWTCERDPDLGGRTPAERATAILFAAVVTATETWHQLTLASPDGMITPDRLVDVVLGLETTLRDTEPWPLFEAAAIAANHSDLASTRHKLAVRITQHTQDTGLTPPDTLLAHVVG